VKEFNYNGHISEVFKGTCVLSCGKEVKVFAVSFAHFQTYLLCSRRGLWAPGERIFSALAAIGPWPAGRSLGRTGRSTI